MSLSPINRVINQIRSAINQSNKVQLDPAAKKAVSLEKLIDNHAEPNGSETKTVVRKTDLSQEGSAAKIFVQSLNQMINCIKNLMFEKKQQPTFVKSSGIENLPEELQNLIDKKNFFQKMSSQLDARSSIELQMECTTLKAKLWSAEIQFSHLKISFENNKPNTSSFKSIHEGRNEIAKLKSEIKRIEDIITKKTPLEENIQKIDAEIKNFNPELSRLSKRELTIIKDIKINNDKSVDLHLKIIENQNQNAELVKTKKTLTNGSLNLFELNDINIKVQKNITEISELEREIAQLDVEKESLSTQLKEIHESIEKLGVHRVIPEKIHEWAEEMLATPEENQGVSINVRDTLSSLRLEDRLEEVNNRIAAYEQNPIPETLLTEKANFENAIADIKNAMLELEEKIEMAQSDVLLQPMTEVLLQQMANLQRNLDSDSAVLADIHHEISNLHTEYLATIEERNHLEKALHEDQVLFSKINPPSENPPENPHTQFMSALKNLKANKDF